MEGKEIVESFIDILEAHQIGNKDNKTVTHISYTKPKGNYHFADDEYEQFIKNSIKQFCL